MHVEHREAAFYGNISQIPSDKVDAISLKKELKSYRAQGVQLYLDGVPSSPKRIAKACMLAEDCGYMRDYTEDEYGRISEVNFHYIKAR